MSIEAGKLMKEQGSGAIVNTASVNALQPEIDKVFILLPKLRW